MATTVHEEANRLGLPIPLAGLEPRPRLRRARVVAHPKGSLKGRHLNFARLRVG